MNSKEKLVAQLKAIKIVMEKVASRDEVLNMGTWYREDETLSCGFAACVCGWVTVESKNIENFSELFPLADSALNKGQAFHLVSRDVVEDLDFNASEFLQSLSLPDSISDGLSKERREHAREFLSEGEVKKFNHLNVDYPTPEDVAEYLDFLITFVGSK